MSRSVRRITDHQKDLVKIFNSLSGRRGRWEVWADWIAMAAIAISNVVDKVHAEEREATYMTIARKYEQQELDAFAEMFALFAEGMDANPDQDFLGKLYMKLKLGNNHAGQFFTPYDVCKAMVKMSVGNLRTQVEEKGWVAVNDSACGAGALLVAFANECRSKKIDINYQTSVLFTAQDIDYTVGMMCYLQLSILGCPGYVVIGNTLTNPMTCYDGRALIPRDEGNVWYTPFYFRQEWHLRRIWAQMDIMCRTRKNIPTAGNMPEKPAQPIATAVEPIEPEPIAMVESETGQLALF